MIFALTRSWRAQRSNLRAVSSLFSGVQRQAISSNSGSSVILGRFLIRQLSGISRTVSQGVGHKLSYLKGVNKLFLISWLLVPSALAQINHVEGWREARWGMTPDQVVAAFHGEALRAPQGKFTDTNILAFIPAVEIEGVHYKVSFSFSPGEPKLKRITLQSMHGSVDEFSVLEQKLVAKYGKPAVSSDNDLPKIAAVDSTKRRAWNLGPTSIELKLWQTLDNQNHR